MSLKRILAVSILAIFLPSIILAQSDSPGKIVITSSPSGAYVTMSGEVKVSGVTPAIFHHLLVGKYDINASLPGYENFNTSIFFDPTKLTEIDLRMKKKSRIKSAMRSIVIPGWGQRYAGQSKKGMVFTTLTVGAVAAYLIADNNFNDKHDDFKTVLGEYDQLSSVSERQQMYPSLVAAQDKAYDAETIKQITVGTIAGVWALNVIDALFFFPENEGRVVVKNLTIQPDLKNKTGLKLTWNF